VLSLRLQDKESLDGGGEGEGEEEEEEEEEEAEPDRFVEACGSPFGPQPKNLTMIAIRNVKSCSPKALKYFFSSC